jgi:molecular chaperone GrpE
MATDPRNPPTDPNDPRPEDLAPFGGGDVDAEQFASRIADLEQSLEAEKSKALRLMADFQNYQRRAFLNEVAARQRGVSEVASSVVGVVDHFDIALGYDSANATAAQVIEGVRVIREELLRALHKHGVSLVNPQPGDEFQPGRHEAIMQQATEGVEAGRIAKTFQAGYALKDGDAERIIRPAKVVVAG